jgi:hypothetical protein
VNAQIGFLNPQAWPSARYQGAVRNNLPGMIEKSVEDIECPAADAHGLAIAF